MKITHASYGKGRVRVVGWTDSSFRDLTISFTVAGDLNDAFEAGDNAKILPSDTLRQHLLDECRKLPDADPVSLLRAIAARLLSTSPALTSARVTADIATERAWTQQVVVILGEELRELATTASGIPIRLRTGSSFTGFARDDLTTQTDAADRPLVGSLDVTWTFGGSAHGQEFDSRVAALVDAFSRRRSNSVQELLTAVARDSLRLTEAIGCHMRFSSAPVRQLGNDQCEVSDSPVGVTEVRMGGTSA